MMLVVGDPVMVSVEDCCPGGVGTPVMPEPSLDCEPETPTWPQAVSNRARTHPTRLERRRAQTCETDEPIPCNPRLRVSPTARAKRFRTTMSAAPKDRGWQPRYLERATNKLETGGFASPPHRGFALVSQ